MLFNVHLIASPFDLIDAFGRKIRLTSLIIIEMGNVMLMKQQSADTQSITGVECGQINIMLKYWPTMP